jgi:DNA-binding NarL/FixJ family response regulator
MTSVVIVADSGDAFAALTAAVDPLGGAYIVRHSSGESPLDRLIASIQPDLVVIADLLQRKHAVARLAEVRRAAPGAKVVVLSSRSIEPDALAIVLRDAIAAEGKHAAPAAVPELVAERSARAVDQRPRRRPRRARLVAQPVEKAA